VIQRLVDLPEECEVAPQWVFERLREIDPRLEVVGIGPAWWAVGRVAEYAPRVRRGREALARWEKLGFTKEKHWPLIRNSLLESQGFGLIGRYQFRGNEDWGAVIEEIRYACYMFEKYEGGDEKTREAIEGVAEETRAARNAAKLIADKHYDERYLFRRIVRGNPAPVTVGADIS